MENLKIEATKYTPLIDFDVSTGKIDVIGKSYPENTFEFYRPVIAWVEAYFEQTSHETTCVNLDLEYLNSSSLKAYFDLFDIFEAVQEKGSKLEIKWIFDEDNDIAEETGEDFIADFESLNIELVVK